MLKLTTSHERRAESAVTIALVGRAKIGKTSQLLTLPPETLCLDFEAGLKAVADWRGDSVPIRSWVDAINVVCLIAGPDPAKPEGQTFSESHHHYCVENFGGTIDPTKYRIVFCDSITDLTRVAYEWAKTQVFGRGGAPDQRGAYGLLGREVVGLLKHLQHAGKTVIFVGGLDRRVDDFGRESFELMPRRCRPACNGRPTISRPNSTRSPGSGGWRNSPKIRLFSSPAVARCSYSL